MAAAPSLREEIARLQELLKVEAHRRRNMQAALDLLSQEGHETSLALQDLRHQIATLNRTIDEVRKRIAALEERLRDGSMQRVKILAAVIVATGTITAAAVALFR